MSMSNHERRQFDLLSQIFASDDPSLARKMAKRVKGSEMTHFCREDVRMVAFGGLFLSILIAFSGFFHQANGLALILGFVLSLGCLGLIRRYGSQSEPTRNPEYSDG